MLSVLIEVEEKKEGKIVEEVALVNAGWLARGCYRGEGEEGDRL